MHIGLIGGIGVAATVDYYKKLTAAVQQNGSKLELTIVHADVNELIRNNSDDEREKQAAIYADLINRLKAAGADCAAITSLGGHFCFEETEKLSSLPLVSAVKPLDDFFVANNIKKVGLLGTRVVMQTKLYGQLEKTDAFALEDELDLIGQTYIDMARIGFCSDEQRRFFIDAGDRLVKNYNVDAIILAGTDLSLAFNGQETDYRVIDALDIHVDLLAKIATDHTSFKM